MNVAKIYTDMSTPVFNALATAAAENAPSFERFSTHEDFLARHNFAEWLYDTTLRAERHTAEPEPTKPIKGQHPSRS